MKKRMKSLIFIASAAALMIAGYFVYKAVAATQKEPMEIVLFEAGGISAISYEYEGETLSFEKHGGEWAYEPDAGYPLNTAYLRDMENALLSVTAEQRLEGGSDEEFGLVDPSCVIAATADSGEAFRCELGNDNDTVNIVYARVDGSVYALSDSFSKVFRHTLLDMASKEKLLDVEASGVTALSLGNGNGHFSLTQYPDGVPGGYSKKLTWAFSDGAYGDSEEMKQLIRTVADMRPAACVGYRPNDSELEAYGFKQPACAVDMEYGGGSFNLLIGNKGEDGFYAVYLPDEGLVYSMGSEAPEVLLGYSRADCKNKYVFLLDYADIASVRMESGAVAKEIDFADDAAWDFYYALSTMRAEGFADEPGAGGGAVELTVNTTGAEPAYTLSFNEYNADFYSVSFMDNSIKLVNKRDVEHILSLAEG